MSSGWHIREQKLDGLDGDVLRACNDLDNALRRERDPDEPAVAPATTRAELDGAEAGYDRRIWIAWSSDAESEALAWCLLDIAPAENAHLVELYIDVHPEHRRRGIGRALLREAVDVCRAESRTTVVLWTVDRVPAGAEFVRRIGAEPAQEERESRLYLDAVDRELVREWCDIADQLAGRYEPWWVDGAYPPAAYGRIAEADAVMNTAPRGDVTMNDLKWTAERVAERDERFLRGPFDRWTLFARERATGRLVALTRVLLDPSRPHLVQQEDTAVHPDHRGQGIGKWIKAAMIDRILTERPEARYIATGNAYSNAPMLAINDGLGFRVDRSNTYWEVPVARLLSYLSENH